MSAQKPLLVCVVGATAIGKTALAIKIAKAFSTEIISADSRQFYKEMAIGTAVPSTKELTTVPHHFIQNKSIFDPYSVGEFERDALQKLDALFLKHPVVVLVGGSGMYVDAIVQGLDTFPKIKDGIRDQLNNELETEGIKNLQQELEKVDTDYFNKIDNKNPRRLIRALEVYRSSGSPYSSFLKKENINRPFKTVYIGLNAERSIIYERINKRVDIMMKEGLLAEATALYPNKELNALQTVGYRELFKFLDGEFTLEQAKAEIKKNTRRFAKRQQTWLTKNPEISWWDFKTNASIIITAIKKKSALI